MNRNKAFPYPFVWRNYISTSQGENDSPNKKWTNQMGMITLCTLNKRKKNLYHLIQHAFWNKSYNINLLKLVHENRNIFSPYYIQSSLFIFYYFYVLWFIQYYDINAFHLFSLLYIYSTYSTLYRYIFYSLSREGTFFIILEMDWFIWN